MQIDFMRALTPSCREVTTCWMCEASFKPEVIMIFGGPHSEEMCELCFKACQARRGMSNVENDWPTWQTYFDLLETYDEPVFSSSEEMTRAEHLGLFKDFEKLAYFVD